MILLGICAVLLSINNALGGPTQPIVNGQDSDKNEYPWQVMLVYDGYFYCGGSILNNRTVLTAAHCVEDDPKQRFGTFSIIAGEWDMSTNEGTEQEIEVQKVKMHKKYDSFELFNDIAILILSEALVWDDSVQPVPAMATKKFDKLAVDNGNCAVSGWGRYNDNNNQILDILQELTPTDVVKNGQCNRALSNYGFSVTAKMVCTIDNNAGVCNGDSGGPMGCFANNGDFTQIGVVSWGPSRTCANGIQVFTRVSKYKGWIKKNSAKV